MEDLDIIRHDMQPGLQPPVDGRAAEPGRWPGCRPRTGVERPAKVGLAIFRESRPRTFAIFRESKAGLRRILLI